MLLLQKRMGALERLEPSDLPRRRQPHHGHALPAQHAVPRLLPPPRQPERMNVERGGDRLHPHPTLPAEAHAASLNSALYSWTFFGPARGTRHLPLLGGSVYKSEAGSPASSKRLLDRYHD